MRWPRVTDSSIASTAANALTITTTGTSLSGNATPRIATSVAISDAALGACDADMMVGCDVNTSRGAMALDSTVSWRS